MEHLAFHFVSRLHHTVVLFLPAFALAWFEPIGAVGNAMSGHGIKQLLVDVSALRRVVTAWDCDQWLERDQCLNRSFKTDGARFEIVLAGGLGDDRPDGVIQQTGRFETCAPGCTRPRPAWRTGGPGRIYARDTRTPKPSDTAGSWDTGGTPQEVAILSRGRTVSYKKPGNSESQEIGFYGDR